MSLYFPHVMNIIGHKIIVFFISSCRIYQNGLSIMTACTAQCTTQEQEMEVDGLKMREKKVLTKFVRDGETDPCRTTLIHNSWIDY